MKKNGLCGWVLLNQYVIVSKFCTHAIQLNPPHKKRMSLLPHAIRKVREISRTFLQDTKGELHFFFSGFKYLRIEKVPFFFGKLVLPNHIKQNPKKILFHEFGHPKQIKVRF